MPSSRRRTMADLRASYTREPVQAARAGVGRGDLGLDQCSAAQRRFRTLLALHLFNRGLGLEPFASSGVSAFLSYTAAMSPQHDVLTVVLDSAVENVVGRLLSTPAVPHGVAGLRVVAGRYARLYHLVHVPTGARMVITDRFPFASADAMLTGRTPSMIVRDLPGVGLPLSADETHACSVADQVPADMQVLLSAIVARLGAGDPHDHWNWWYWGSPHMTLSGIANSWQLTWTRTPHADELVTAMLDTRFGLSGLDVSRAADGSAARLRLGEAELHLQYGG